MVCTEQAPLKRYHTQDLNVPGADDSDSDDFDLKQHSLAAQSKRNSGDRAPSFTRRGTALYTAAMLAALEDDDAGAKPDAQAVCHGLDLGCVQMLKHLDRVHAAVGQAPLLLGAEDRLTHEGEQLMQAQLEVQNMQYALSKELERLNDVTGGKAGKPQEIDSALLLVPGMRTALGQLSEYSRKFSRHADADLGGIAQACDFAVQRMEGLASGLGAALEAVERTKERARLQDVFHRLDTNKNGRLSAPEFHPFLEAIDQVNHFSGAKQTFEELVHQSTAPDRNVDGCMGFDEFEHVVLETLPTKESRAKVLAHLAGAEHVVAQAKESAEDSRRITKVFRKLDADGSGELDRAEFQAFLVVLAEADASGRTLKLDVDAVMNAMDTDGDGMIDLDEFRALLMHLLPSQERRLKAFDHIDRRAGVAVKQQQELKKTVDRLAQVFSRLDKDANGTLDAEEFRNFLAAVSKAEFFPGGVQADVDAILAEVDSDGNGVVDIDEFCAWVVSKMENKFCRKNKQRVDSVLAKLSHEC